MAIKTPGRLGQHKRRIQKDPPPIFKAAATKAAQLLFRSFQWADCNDKNSFLQATKIVKQLFKTLSENKIIPLTALDFVITVKHCRYIEPLQNINL